MFASCPAVCDLSLLKTFLVFEKKIVQQMTEKGGSALAQEMMENKMFVNVFQISFKLHISVACIA